MAGALHLFLEFLENIKNLNKKSLILTFHGGNDLHTLVLNLAHVGQLGRFLGLVEEFCDFQAVLGKYYEENALH